MRLEWLEDILAVATTGSFFEAAERRHLTQSAFSRRIQTIEQYVGVPLFDRSRKPVQLCPTTEDQRNQIIHLTAALRQLLMDLRRGDRRSSNRIAIGSQHALTTALMPGIVKSIQERQHDIYVRLRSANLDECFALLLARQVDIALVYRAPEHEHPTVADYIETMTIGGDRLIPVCATASTGHVRERITAGEIPIIAYPGEVFFGQVLGRSVLSRLPGGTQVVPKAETALTLAALEMANSGLGVAWVPASLARRQVAQGALTDLSERIPFCDLLVTAIRLAGDAGRAESFVWELLGSPR